MHTVHQISSQIKRKSPRAQGGFTLIEMMVSVSIFLIVMTIVLGALLSIIDGNKKTQAINSVANNLSSAIESMTRDIKTGYQYKCGVSRGTIIAGTESANCDPATALDTISFISTISGSARAGQYWLSDPDPITGRKGIMKFFCPANIKNPNVNCKIESNYESLVITSPEIDIKEMQFYVKVPTASTDQPGVFVVIKGTAYINKTQFSDFSIQTFISQRLLNL